jgi:hypothetical protein
MVVAMFVVSAKVPLALVVAFMVVVVIGEQRGVIFVLLVFVVIVGEELAFLVEVLDFVIIDQEEAVALAFLFVVAFVMIGDELAFLIEVFDLIIVDDKQMAFALLVVAFVVVVNRQLGLLPGTAERCRRGQGPQTQEGH